MTIDTFTKEQFEASLPTHNGSGIPMWEYLEQRKGEHVYIIRVDNTNKRIVIRSSVNAFTGVSASTGQDSIRHWLEYWYKGRWRAMAKDIKAWTNRVPGWETRLKEALRRLYKAAVVDTREHTNNCTHNWEQVSANWQVCSECGFQRFKQAEIKPDPEPEPENVFSVLGDENGIEEPEPIQETTDETPADVFSMLGDEVEQDIEIDTGDWTPPTFANASQVEAMTADHKKSLRVLAPPGSGKTFMLSYRYGYLLSQGVDPNSIVAVTFSRDMADELCARIRKQNPALGLADNEQAVRQITTIHALCFRILREEGDRRVIPGPHSPVKGWMVKKEINDIIDKLWPVAHHRPGWKEVMSFINLPKLHGLTSNEDMKVYGGIRDKWGNLVELQLHNARLQFDNWAKRNKVITFADMLYDVDIRLRESPTFRKKYQARFQYFFIDEGQDTSGQAMRILSTLAQPQNNVTIVGDTDQLLYRFTGATPEANLYAGFEERYPDGNTIKLSTNYRSTQTIVESSVRLIRNNYTFENMPEYVGPYDEEYFKDALWRDDAPEGEPITFQMYTTPLEEGVAVAEQIRVMLDSGREPDHFFIGCRTCAQTGYLEGKLTQLKIPYINLVGRSFWGLKHVEDVIAYLALAYDESDSAAFERVYNIASADNTHPWGEKKGEYCHHRYLGKKFLQACYDGQSKAPAYKWVWKAVEKRRSYANGVRDLTNFIDRIKGVMGYEGIKQTIEFIVEECYEDYLAAEEGLVQGDDADAGKLDDLLTVADIAGDFESVKDFLEYVDNARKSAEAAKDGNWEGHVVISTVHRLKGQERPVVFGTGWCEGFDKSGMPAGLLPHTFSLRPPPQNGVLPAGGMGRIEDERDVAFVLISRAQEEVHLSGCRNYRKAVMEPSRFVYELGLLNTQIPDSENESE